MQSGSYHRLARTVLDTDVTEASGEGGQSPRSDSVELWDLVGEGGQAPKSESSPDVVMLGLKEEEEEEKKVRGMSEILEEIT